MNHRRNFIKKTALTGAGIALLPNLGLATNLTRDTQKLRVGVIGVGLRGTNHLDNLLKRNDVVVTAICDLDPNRIDIAQDHIQKAGGKKAKTFGKNELDYRNLLALQEIDAVVIATPWLWHTKMAVDSMKAGKYTGLEVSAANTLEECWDLVNTHEETGSHLMILENVNYRRDVLAVLNRIRKRG